VRAAILNRDRGADGIRRAIQEAGLAEIPRLESNLRLLATVAHVLPLVGLLGTVLGLVEALFVIEQSAPLVHAGDLAGGLWTALISTAAGLAVAIPTYAGHQFLCGKVDATIQNMERTAAEILTFLTSPDREQVAPRHEPAPPDRA
jgi:biopolymer transport protein ExbB